MAEFSAKDIAALRKATGAGMMDCKKRAGGVRRRRGARASTWLRAKGLSKATKMQRA